jgi:hypothetical protein
MALAMEPQVGVFRHRYDGLAKRLPNEDSAGK